MTSRRLIALAAALLAAPMATAALPVVHHDARVTFDVAAHEVTIEDALLVPAGLDSFQLAAAFDPARTAMSTTVDTALGEPVARGLVGWRDAHTPVTLRYAARVHQDAATMRFSRENVANEITGTVGEDGIYLSSALPWLPSFAGALNTYRVTVVTPAGWLPVTQGEVVNEEETDGQRTTVFNAVHPSDGITVIAHQYYRYADSAGKDGKVKAQVFLLEPDEKLRDTYLERTQAYIAMYEDMLGPYPFEKFATVENWFPTGYGMPGWTLLGAQVMRLPFIPYTSFGHEICHDWWGNGVMVNPAEGNWCEGLTVWCADYHYKALESAEAARDYRHTLLKDYAAYVGRDPKLDFPLTEFKSRHSGATRAVGYGKSMMVWHMLSQELGHDTVLQGLRDVVSRFTYQEASWSDFFAAIAKVSGRDLSAFQDQWLTRPGAPTLTLEEPKRDGDAVTFTLSQGMPPYTLEVPVVVSTPQGDVRTTVTLAKARDSFRVKAPGATTLSVDPDFDLFRRLWPQEIDPTLAQVLAEPSPNFVLPFDASQKAAAEGFAHAFTETDPPALITGGVPPQDIDPTGAVTSVLMNPRDDVLTAYLPDELKIAGDLVFIAGKRYSLKDYDLVFAARSPYHLPVTDLVIVTRTPDRLPRLGERLGHYGKYGWLLLPAASGQVLKGNWSTAASPLTATLAG